MKLYNVVQKQFQCSGFTTTAIFAVCPVGRGCCLENSLDVKVSGVQIPNTAFAINMALICGVIGKR